MEHHHTINDVVLAMVAGGLRSWLLTRGESIISGSSLTALVPMSVLEDEVGTSSLGVQVAPHVQDLPVGEANALVRLHQVAYSTKAHRDSGRAVDALIRVLARAIARRHLADRATASSAHDAAARSPTVPLSSHPPPAGDPL